MRTAIVIAALTLCACGKIPEQGANAKLFGQSSAAPGFNFQTTRPVALTITAQASALGGTASAPLRIARPDGQIVYRGRIGAAKAVHMNLPVATKDAQFVATLTRADGSESSLSMPITGGSAMAVFQ